MPAPAAPIAPTPSNSKEREEATAAPANPSQILALQRGPEDAPLQPVGPDPALQAVARLLGRRVEVTVLDGRTLAGTLACLDPQGNIVLQDAGRLGTLIVPAAQRVRVVLEVADVGEVAAFSALVEGQ